jgi:hypothetical protein
MEDPGIPKAEAEAVSNIDLEVVESDESSADLKLEKVEKVDEVDDDEEEFDLVSQ